MADVTARMLALLAALQTGRSFSGDELAARVEVSPRTLRRDVDRLRRYGYPVDTQRGPGGYYRLAPGSRVPPLLLEDDEAVATLIGLAVLAASNEANDDGNDAHAGLDDAAARAYSKIDQVLPRRLRPRASAIRASVETSVQRAPKVPPAILSTIADAVTNRAVVRFTYRDAQGSTSQRRVEPVRQVHLHLRWYLVGWDRDRADWRTFRIDRVVDLTTTTVRFEPRPLPAGSALDLVRTAIAAGRRRATVIVEAPRDAVIDALRYQDVDVVAVSPTTTQLTIAVESWEWLVLNLAVLGVPFTILEPDDIRHACAVFAERLHAATRPT